ncbi:AlpA family phage regulatory protein [Sphingomonas sp. BIUV-7]|uniref:AlpA family phage regulatory protein n=2 Tax=Sphingomonas natans TaxID=3063330 RepID=A0ABT8Y6N7_9SPHN|nr:AlpA family phage regulatory protein [Sphingomonas sp. BIUV-7]MDO6413578.1 AlpA family phage regulatory protein [Sphingomonas sp. BIUV-7]
MLSQAQVCRALNLSRATLHRMRRVGAFPPPLRLSVNRIAWRASVVERWLADRDPQLATILS